MSQKNIFYAQSGGATAVINATACGLIQAAREQRDKLGTVYAGNNGILGALNEELIDTNDYSDDTIAALLHTPGSAFGSCRYKLQPIEQNDYEYRRLIDVFKAHNIGYFFYNGGGDSQDTAYKVSQMSQQLNYPLICIGLPKTIDNDLPFTACSPGFGSAAKYVAISTHEAAMDVACMAKTSTKVFILEVMGRHAGWLAASSGLACRDNHSAPHVILFPEIPFNQPQFLARVTQAVEKHGHCVIVAAEGIRNPDGSFLSQAQQTDAFGHARLGGVAPKIAHIVHDNLGYKYHWAVSDYLQRAARHVASKTDLDHAYALGKAGIDYALNGINNVMLTINNHDNQQWGIGHAPLADVANQEHTMPSHFISEDGYGITDTCRDYLKPLIQGEAYPPYHNGLPHYVALNHQLVKKKLTEPFKKTHTST